MSRSTVCAASTDMDALLGEPWMLSPSVALRPEPFGALAYHFGNRKLTFLKRPELVAVVRALGEAPDVRTALDHAGVPAPQHARSEEHTSELQSLMRNSYAVFCLKKKNH